MIDDLGENTFLRTKKGNKINEIIILALHLKTQVWSLWQKAIHPPPVYRCNAETVVLFKIYSEKEIITVKDHYITIRDTETLRKILEYVFEEPYNFILILRKLNDTEYWKNGEEKLRILDYHI
jgi:hypothetical protein